MRIPISESDAETLLLHLERPGSPSLLRLCDTLEEALEAQGRRRCDCGAFFDLPFRSSWPGGPNPPQTCRACAELAGDAA